eukprot:11167515-Lingulodinium_polyedra.AAC.1
MKVLRSTITLYQPVSSTPWGQAALNAANEELERFRVRLLDAKPPVSRMQSACQRRDKARGDLEAAEKAFQEAKERAVACSRDVARAKEAFHAAEEEMLKASEAMAGPRPMGITAVLEE